MLYLLGMCKALDLIPVPQKKEERKQGTQGQGWRQPDALARYSGGKKNSECKGSLVYTVISRLARAIENCLDRNGGGREQ